MSVRTLQQSVRISFPHQSSDPDDGPSVPLLLLVRRTKSGKQGVWGSGESTADYGDCATSNGLWYEILLQTRPVVPGVGTVGPPRQSTHTKRPGVGDVGSVFLGVTTGTSRHRDSVRRDGRIMSGRSFLPFWTGLLSVLRHTTRAPVYFIPGSSLGSGLPSPPFRHVLRRSPRPSQNERRSDGV